MGIKPPMLDSLSQETPSPLRLALCRTTPAFVGAACLSPVQSSQSTDWQAVLMAAKKAPLRLGSNGQWLLLPALDAAKARLHPLALLQAYAKGANANQLALSQAGRLAVDAEILFENPSVEAVVEYAEMLAKRSHPVFGSYWSHPRYQSRVLALLGNEVNGEHQSIVLTQGSERIVARLNGGELPWILPLWLPRGDWSSVQRRLTQIQGKLHAVKSTTALSALIQQCFDEMEPGDRALVLVGVDAKALASEAATLSSRLADSLKDESELSTPAGSVFSPTPAGADGLAFVYPGVGTANSHMLQDLHLYFPEAFDALDEACRQHGISGLAGILLPQALSDNPSLAELAVSGVGASFLMTRILQDELGIKPAICLGYSMGEAAMVAAQGLWQDPFAMVEDTLQSPLFANGISGKLDAVRAHWRLDDNASLNWKSLVLRTSANDLRPMLADFPKVSIAISQGPSTVLAGCDDELKALLKRLGKRALYTKLVTAMHTSAAQPLTAALGEFYQRPLAAPLPNALPLMLSAGTANQRTLSDVDADVDDDAAVSGLNANLSSAAIASAIATTFANELNFDELVLSAFKAGGRIFAEVGAGREASSIVQAIGDDNALPLTAQPSDGQQGKALQKLLARLIAHSIPMELSRLRPMGAERLAQETIT